MKWLSTSICLVRACETGLEAKDNAPELSHQMVGGDGRDTYSFWNSIRSQ
jgi:hypothetical protein